MQRADFFKNIGGLNLTDSPFFVKDEQATGGYNYDYSRTGGIQKVRGLLTVNSSPDAQLKTLGIGVHNSISGVKTVIRAAGTKIQAVDIGAPSFTDLSTDTASPTTDVLTAGSTQPVATMNYNTPSADLLHLVGGGMTLPMAYTGTELTQNGVPVPTGTFTAVNQGSGTGGDWGTATGVYFYALVLRKRSTQALSNAALDTSITIATATDSVLLTFPTGVDATYHDQWFVYRSEVGGVDAFTTGTLVAQVAVGTATYTDDNVTVVADSQNIPRAGNPILDNSVLPAGTYNMVARFKQRLVVASGNTVYISDLNKSESWPIGLPITLTSGGPVTALGTIGSYLNDGVADEYLVIFKERETWIVAGTALYDDTTALYDIEVKFVDSVGCIAPNLVASTNGYLCWIDYRGVYMWSGQGKPVYCSRPIEALFGLDGDLDKTKLTYSWGTFVRSKNQVIWTLSHRTKGENAIQLKLDLRLSSPRSAEGIVAGVVVSEGVFSMDASGIPLYGGASYLPADNEEVFLVGDNTGTLYRAYYALSNGGEGIEFSYTSKALDLGLPSVAKQFNKVIVYLDQSVSKDLTLDYWSGYRVLDADRSTISQTMDTAGGITGSFWDLATWDVSEWDNYTPLIISLVYNLDSSKNNNQGDSILLKFSQPDSLAPVTIHGFTILWDELTVRK